MRKGDRASNVINKIINNYQEYSDELQIHHNIFIDSLPPKGIMNLVFKIQTYKQFINELKIIQESLKKKLRRVENEKGNY